MAEEEKDPERELRINALLRQFIDITTGCNLAEVHAALANLVSKQAFASSHDPDGVFMDFQFTCIEVHMAVREHMRKAHSPPTPPQSNQN